MKQEFLVYLRANHRPGVLARITGMFYRRAINIGSVSVGEQSRDGLVTMVVRTRGNEEEIRRLVLSLANLVDVREASLRPLEGLGGREFCRLGLRSRADFAAVRASALAAGLDLPRSESSGSGCQLEVVGSPLRLDEWLGQVPGACVQWTNRSGVLLDPYPEA